MAIPKTKAKTKAKNTKTAKPKGPICPRCGGYIPSNLNPGAFDGALSRADDDTEVCSPCGTEEAMLDWAASEKAGHYVRGTTKADWKRPDVARSVGGEAGV